jgi:hypothetical protein
MMKLQAYISQLDNCFDLNDRYESHKQAAPILLAMAKDRSILYEIISNNIVSDKTFTLKKQGPVIGFDIVIKRNYTFSAHCFFPLPDRAEDVSHNWIHHHDHSLLTSVNAFGDKGYSSFLFNKDYKYDEANNKITNLKIEREFNHPLHNVEFIDAFIPHVVFLPEDLMITYALWSFDYVIKADWIRSNPIAQAFKTPIKKLISLFGAMEKMQIEVETDNRQFAPTEGGFRCMFNKLYPYGSNENYLQNLFYVLQKVGYNEVEALEKLNQLSLNKNRKDVSEWINKLKSNETINDHYDPIYQNIDGLNFTKAAVRAASKY